MEFGVKDNRDTERVKNWWWKWCCRRMHHPKTCLLLYLFHHHYCVVLLTNNKHVLHYFYLKSVFFCNVFSLYKHVLLSTNVFLWFVYVCVFIHHFFHLMVRFPAHKQEMGKFPMFIVLNLFIPFYLESSFHLQTETPFMKRL